MKCIMFSCEASDDRQDGHDQAEPCENFYERRGIVFGYDKASHSKIFGKAAGDIFWRSPALVTSVRSNPHIWLDGHRGGFRVDAAAMAPEQGSIHEYRSLADPE